MCAVGDGGLGVLAVRSSPPPSQTMSKPTLVQSLLNRPSQTYSTPAPATKDYYSTRQEMLRIAHAAQHAQQPVLLNPRAPQASAPAGSGRSKPPAAPTTSQVTTTSIPRSVQGPSAASSSKSSISPATSLRRPPPATVASTSTPQPNPQPHHPSGRTAAPPTTHKNPTKPPAPAQEEEDGTTGESDLEVYFTPNTSPRTSMASSVATVTFPSNRKPSRRSLRNDNNSNESSPVAGPSHSITLSKSQSNGPVPPNQSRPPNAKLVSPFTAVPSTRTPSNPSARALHALSTTSSLSSTSLDGHSIFSDYLGLGSTESTILTTPYQSEEEFRVRGKEKDKVNRPVNSTTTANAAHKNPGSKNTMTINAAAAPGNWKDQQYHYTDEDWAKDVKWLIPPQGQGRAQPATSTPVRQVEDASRSRGKTKQGPEPKSKAGFAAASNSDSQSSKAKGSERKASSPMSTVTTPKDQTQSGLGRSNSGIAGVGAGNNIRANSNPNGSSKAKEKEKAKGKDRTSKEKPTYYVASHGMPLPPSPTSSSGTNTPPRVPQHHQPHTFSPFAPHPSSSKSTSTPNANGYTNGHAYNQVSKPGISHRRNPSSSKVQPSIMMNMSALLEEDEEGPLTPRMEQTLRELEGGWGAAAAAAAKPEMKRRRSRSLDSSTSTSRSNTNSQAKSAQSKGTHARTLTAEVQALNLASAPGDLPSKGTHGYTSLVLPRAPVSLNARPSSTHLRPTSIGGLTLGADGKIDLTRSGVAQTTMASVEVVRGLGLARGGGGLLGVLGTFGRKRAGSVGHYGPPPSVAMKANGAGVRGASFDGVPGGAGVEPAPLGVEGTLLGFTSYRPPPNYVPSSGVLVQVWAVGVDGVDGRLVGVKFGSGGTGVIDRDLEDEEEHDEGVEGDEDEDVEGEQEQRLLEDEKQAQEDQTPLPPPATKKNPFAALGRSLSLTLSRNGSAKKTPQRSASSATYKSKKEQVQAPPPVPTQPHKRSNSFSLKRNNTATSFGSNSEVPRPGLSRSSSQKKAKSPPKKKKQPKASVGYIPGRSFVGRVLECGWDVPDETVKKGEWVVGLLDVRKCGALAEFIIVDRRRVHRVPHPRKGVSTQDPNAPASPVWVASTKNPGNGQGESILATLTLEELALLPLCGLPAYRAVRTFLFAFSSLRDNAPLDRRPGYDFGTAINSGSGANVGGLKALIGSDEHGGHRRRVLVLRGHDGVGAMAVQMLVRRGWRVSVHVPFSSVPAEAMQDVGNEFMRAVEERAREWGADEVIFDDGEEGGGVDDGRGAAVRVIDSLREDGDVFDAILDTIGGKEVREAGERLLRSNGRLSMPSTPGSTTSAKPKRHGVGQFTTLVGDVPERAIPTAGDHFRAGLRSLRLGPSNDANASNGQSNDAAKAGDDDLKGSGKVGYAWVSVAQDVDWEGEDVGETLGTVIRFALEGGVRPLVEDVDGGMLGRPRVVPFEKAPYVFVDNGPLGDGGTVVVKVAG